MTRTNFVSRSVHKSPLTHSNYCCCHQVSDTAVHWADWENLDWNCCQVNPLSSCLWSMLEKWAERLVLFHKSKQISTLAEAKLTKFCPTGSSQATLCTTVSIDKETLPTSPREVNQAVAMHLTISASQTQSQNLMTSNVNDGCDWALCQTLSTQ